MARGRSSRIRGFLPPALLLGVCASAVLAPACLDPEAITHEQPYDVVEVKDGGMVTGRVTWGRVLPDEVRLPVTKDPEACGGLEKVLPRLKVSRDKRVQDTVVYLSDVLKGKPFPSGVTYRLDQRGCEFVPHVMLVPKGAALLVASSDNVLHTVHMTGALTENIALPDAGAQPVPVTMKKEGLVELADDNGHAWMSGSIVVMPHPYYTVSDANGEFRLADVPPGLYEIVAWHEGWEIDGRDMTLGVVARYHYSRSVIKKDKVEVKARETAEVAFELGWR